MPMDILYLEVHTISRLNKKELEGLARQYYWYNTQKEEYAERLQGLVMTLQIIGQLNNVRYEAFKIRNQSASYQIEQAKKLIEKARDNHKFDITLLENYYDNVEFYDKLDYEEKSILKGCIDYILQYTNYNDFIELITS